MPFYRYCCCRCFLTPRRYSLCIVYHSCVRVAFLKRQRSSCLIASCKQPFDSQNDFRMCKRKCDLKTHVQNLGYFLPLQIEGPNHLFWPTSQPDGNFNGLYLRNETRYRQSVKCVDNYKRSPTPSLNVMNFGLHTPSNWAVILTHPEKIRRFSSLPGLAYALQTTELNQTLPRVSRYTTVTNCSKILWVLYPAKI